MIKLFLKVACVTTIVAASLSASAQQQPTPTPTEFTLKLSAQRVELIGKALGKLSYEEVAPFMNELQTQINAQIQAAQKAAPVTPPAK